MVITTVQKAIALLSRDQNVIPHYFGGLLNYLEQVIKVFGFSFSLLRNRDNGQENTVICHISHGN